MTSIPTVVTVTGPYWTMLAFGYSNARPCNIWYGHLFRGVHDGGDVDLKREVHYGGEDHTGI